MRGAVRTVAKELESLAAGLGQRMGRRRRPEVTRALAAEVLGKDVAKVGRQARSLARLEVRPGGEAASRTLETAADGFAANRVAGDQREAIVQAMLRGLFPAEKGYTIKAEQYLRDRFGRIAKDRATGQSRRIDFAIFRGKRVMRLLEVTSEHVDKAFQMAKEARMRRQGGRYLLHPVTGERVRIPAEIKTSVIRLP